MEDPDFAKQDNRDPAASPLAYLPTKLLKEGFNVPPRQTAAYRSGEDQLKDALVPPLHSTIVLPLGTRCGYLSTVCGIRMTLPLSGRQGAIAPYENRTAACPHKGCVSRFHTLLTGHSAVEGSLCNTTTFWVLFPHDHRMQKQNLEIHREQESCESLTGALHAIRWTGQQQAPFRLLQRARDSSTDGEREADTYRLGFAIFKPVGNNTKSQYLRR